MTAEVNTFEVSDESDEILSMTATGRMIEIAQGDSWTLRFDESDSDIPTTMIMTRPIHPDEPHGICINDSVRITMTLERIKS